MIFNEEQKCLLEKIGIKLYIDKEPDEAEIEEKVGDYLIHAGFDENYEPTAEGLLCESILDMLEV